MKWSKGLDFDRRVQSKIKWKRNHATCCRGGSTHCHAQLIEDARVVLAFQFTWEVRLNVLFGSRKSMNSSSSTEYNISSSGSSSGSGSSNSSSRSSSSSSSDSTSSSSNSSSTVVLIVAVIADSSSNYKV